MKSTGRAAGVAIGTVLVISIHGCGLDAPQAPSWVASYTVPLFVNQWEAVELLEELDTHFVYDESDPSSLALEVEIDLDPISLAEALVVSEASSTSTYRLRDLGLEVDLDAEPSLLVLRDLHPEIDQGGGYEGVVNPFSFNVSIELLDAISYEHLDVEYGSLVVTLTNELPVEVFSRDEPPENRLILLRRGDGTLIAESSIDATIAPGTQHNVSFGIGGASLDSDIVVEISGTSPGSGSSPVWIDPESALIAEAAIGIPWEVASLEGQPESIEQTLESSFSLDQDVVVESAEIASGQLEVQFENHFPLALSVDLRIPTHSRDGSILQEEIWLPPQSSRTSYFDLAGVLVNPVPESHEFLVEAVVRTEDRRQFPVTIDDDDMVVFGSRQSECTFEEVTGYFASPVDMEEVETESGLGDIDLGMHFADPRGTIDFSGELTVPLDLNLVVEDPVGGSTLNVRGSVPAGGGSIQLDPQELAIFLAAAPATIVRSGELSIGDSGTIITVNDSDQVSPIIRISAPLRFSMEARSDTLDSELVDEVDGEIRKMLLERVEKATLSLRVASGLPIGVGLAVHLDPDPTLVTTNAAVILPRDGLLEVAAAETDESGRPLGETIGVEQIEIEAEDLQLLFAGDSFYMNTLLQFPGTAGKTVSMYGSDALEVSAQIEFMALVGGLD